MRRGVGLRYRDRAVLILAVVWFTCHPHLRPYVEKLAEGIHVGDVPIVCVPKASANVCLKHSGMEGADYLGRGYLINGHCIGRIRLKIDGPLRPIFRKIHLEKLTGWIDREKGKRMDSESWRLSKVLYPDTEPFASIWGFRDSDSHEVDPGGFFQMESLPIVREGSRGEVRRTPSLSSLFLGLPVQVGSGINLRLHLQEGLIQSFIVSIQRLFSQLVRMPHFGELPIHGVELTTVYAGGNDPHNYKANLAANVEFFQPVKFSSRFGCYEVGVGIGLLLSAWYALLWGYGIRRVRIAWGIAGWIAAFVLIGHGIYLLAEA